MASSTTAGPSLLDATTLYSLLSTLAILLTAYLLSRHILAPSTPTRLRALFIWHAFDALIHFILEGSFVYHCLFSVASVEALGADDGGLNAGSGLYWPDPAGFLGVGAVEGRGVVHGPQAGAGAGAGGGLAMLWLVYAKADARWQGADLTVLSIEIITVLFAGSMACLVCYDIARKNPRANLVMVVLATAEIYGGYMTFMPEWLSGSANLDTSNWMYKWIFLIFFNGLWVVIPLYAIHVAADDMFDAFRARATALGEKKVQ
ncbi:Emopamil-binding protein [Trichocladium antarcticum]|uniref:Emopamil-binding protein n=1 Tax=Trichocladium antarcticum TaxID=1450529 RepID=A0AAN6URH5_9PEZI|nr:Emopamil-binding protein [Trichocladium antarcticum]